MSVEWNCHGKADEDDGMIRVTVWAIRDFILTVIAFEIASQPPWIDSKSMLFKFNKLNREHAHHVRIFVLSWEVNATGFGVAEI